MFTFPRSLRRVDLWFGLLVASVVASLPTQVHFAVFGGLVNVRPWEPALVVLLVVVVASYRAARWQFNDVVAYALLLTAGTILVRSIVRLLTEAEPHFRILTDWTGAPAWQGATKTKGLVSALLLAAYVVVAIVAAGLSRHRGFGARIVNQATTVLMWSLAIYAVGFIVLLGFSIAVYGTDPTSWPITVRGIDVGHFRTRSAVAFFGPFEGVTFAAGAALAAARARVSAHETPLALAFAATQAMAATLTFSRGAWLALVVGFAGLVLTWTGVKPRSIAIGFAAVAALIVLTIGLLVIVHTQEPAIGSRLFSVVGSTSGARFADWQRMLQAFLRTPAFGYGAESFRPLTFGFPAENLWLEVAVSGGLLALVPLVLAHAKVMQLFVAARSSGADAAETWLMPLFLAFVVYLTGTFSNQIGWSPVYWLLLGLTLGSLRRVLARGSSLA
jgi:O-antigen ligase